MKHRSARSRSDVDRWMEEQYRKSPGLRESVAAEVAEMELQMGLVKLREERGVSQTQLARMLGVSQPAIAKLEGGTPKDVKVSTLVKYAAALGARVAFQIIPHGKPGTVVPIAARRTPARSARR